MIIPVKRVTIVTLTGHEDLILDGLGKLGIVQLEKLPEEKFEGLREVITKEEVAKYTELYEKFQSLFEKASKEIRLSKERLAETIPTGISIEELEESLNDLEKAVANLDHLKEVKSTIRILKDQKIDLKDLGEFEHVFTKAGIISRSSIPKLEDALKAREDVDYKIAFISDADGFLRISGPPNAKSFVDEILSRLEFKELKLPPEAPREMKSASSWVEKEMELVRNKISEIVVKLGFGNRIKHSLKAAKAKSNLLRGEMVSVITGWTPKDTLPHLNDFLEKIKEKVGGQLAIYYEDPKHEEEVPTILRNPKLFTAYETLTRQYGMPSHEEIDPTPILGVLWTIMFGLMFPDAGQGLTILALGALFAYKLKRFMGMSFVRVGKLMMGLGVSATIFGLLAGEFFLWEIEPLFPGLEPGWLKHSVNVLWLIKIAIFFGIAALTIGLILNMVNCWKAHEKLEALLGERGLAGVFILYGLVLTIFNFLGMNVIPGVLRFPKLGVGAVAYLGVSMIGVAMIIAKSIIAKEGVMTSMGPIIEGFVGFFCNMMSFARIAGFCIAHAALATVVHEMMIANPAMGIGVGLIFLNLFCLSLELLVVMIQALRLLFYEFSTKFFRGTGSVYTPFKF
jgi:V/A-type H+-transporting ATPase subunit I